MAKRDGQGFVGGIPRQSRFKGRRREKGEGRQGGAGELRYSITEGKDRRERVSGRFWAVEG